MLPLVRLHRYHPAVYAVPVVVAALTLYYLQESSDSPQTHHDQAPGLHRSNARRRRRSQPNDAEVPRLDLSFLNEPADNVWVFGQHRFSWSHGEEEHTDISRDAFGLWNAAVQAPASEDAREFRAQLQDVCLSFYLYNHLRHQSLEDAQQEEIITSLEGSGFAQDRTRHFLALNQNGRLRDHICEWIHNEVAQGRDLDSIVLDEALRAHVRNDPRSSGVNAITEIDSSSDVSWQVEDNSAEDQQGDKNLLALLYAMAQDKNRREGFVHRGITCNCCGTHPIKGIRYRCTACNDFDICEICEGQGYHTPTHLLYKIRIPRSHLGSQAQPILYPGRYSRYTRSLTASVIEKMVVETGFTEAEIEGFWEQFRCLASVDWPADPFKYGLAIDRRSFEQLLYPSNSARPSAPNIIYDRIFSFYDSNDDDLIGFKEFIRGLSILRKKGPKEKWKRIFQCFDIDRDGYINRKDFQRMFRAHYNITREMTSEIVANMEDDSSDEDLREMLTSGQPISASFTSQSPSGQPSRTGYGKHLDNHGDHVIVDRRGALCEEKQTVDFREVVAQRAEHRELSNVDQDPLTFTTLDVRDKVRDLYDETWPSHRITDIDVEAALGERLELDQIHDRNEQLSVCRVAQRRLAWDWQRRHFVRSQAVKTREMRELVLPSDDTSASSSDSIMNKLLGKSFAEWSSPLSRSTSLYQPRKELQDLQCRVEELVKQSSMEFGSGRLHDLLLIFYEVGFSKSEVMENLKGYTLIDEDLQRFVTSLFEIFRGFSIDHPYAASLPTEFKLVKPSKPVAQTRLGQSIPKNPGFGPIDSPPSNELVKAVELTEEDVGQEILFQLAQEALNELIDPFLKAREDLWLEAQTTKAKRQNYKKAIRDSVKDPLDLFRWLKSFLKHIQLTPDYPPRTDHWSQSLRSEAANLRDFLKFTGEGIFNNLTSQTCPKCAGKIHIGRFCGQCGASSAANDMLYATKSTEEMCEYCSAKGLVRPFRSDYDICLECRGPSAKRDRDEQWLQEILSGDEDRATSKHSITRQYGGQLSRNIAGQRSTSPNRAQATNDTKVTASSSGTGGSDSPDLSGGDTSPGAADSTHPPTPSSASHDFFDLDGRESQSVEETQFTDAVADLQEAVRNFDERVLPQETKIPQKPLEELLHEAGFTTKTNDGELSRRIITDVNIQNPIDHTCLPAISYSYSDKDAHLYRDPTLPQNRPNSLQQIPNSLSSTPSNPGTPDVATLRFWAALTILEAEDEQVRGGPGRLSEEEFVAIMLGERGKGLEYVGDWMNLTAF